MWLSKRAVLADVPPERKPERGYIRMLPRNANRKGGYVRMFPQNKTRNDHKGGTVTGGYGFGYVSDMYPSPF